MSDFFNGFVEQYLEVDGGTVRYRRSGTGPPLLLLHGNPQTHAMWHAVAPTLARDFDVVCPDLRGYGRSFKPDVPSNHAPYAKREMANDMIQLMEHLGHVRFSVGSHDRGARVAHRMALDWPDRVARLAVLDIVPTLEHFERADMDFAMGYYHWFWLAQPHPGPETLISADPETWFRFHTSREPKGDDFFHPNALADYLAAVQNTATITAICEDYRAAATIDLVHDRDSRSQGLRIQCPLLTLWGAKGKIGKWYDPVEIWQAHCDGSVSGHAINSGHYLAEEQPEAVIQRFRSFFE